MPDGFPTASSDEAQTVTGDRIRSFVERAERLHEERAALADDLKELFAEAKGQGFDVKVLKKIIQDRAKDPNERAEFEALLDAYKHALGMI